MHRLFNAAAALLLGLSIAFAPIGREAGAVVVDEGKPNQAGLLAWTIFLQNLTLIHNLTGRDAVETARAARIKAEASRIRLIYNRAVESLKAGDKENFDFHRKELRLLKTYARYRDNQKLARTYLRTIPILFLTGVALVNEDGTLARDPDPFVRLRLQIDQDHGEGGSDRD